MITHVTLLQASCKRDAIEAAVYASVGVYKGGRREQHGAAERHTQPVWHILRACREQGRMAGREAKREEGRKTGRQAGRQAGRRPTDRTERPAARQPSNAATVPAADSPQRRPTTTYTHRHSSPPPPHIDSHCYMLPPAASCYCSEAAGSPLRMGGIGTNNAGWRCRREQQ